MKRIFQRMLEIGLLIIISFPAIYSLLNQSYFSMHDDQQIARLYLLSQGIAQGNLFPRWVGEFGFGFGYPLFNFYPPLAYYVGFLFREVGFSYVWAAKSMFITFTVIGTFGAYFLSRQLFSRKTSYIVAVLYTYFYYRAVGVYVRGALAEFAAASLLPILFVSVILLYRRNNLRSAFFYGFVFALLILAHPLVAFPSVIFIGLLFLFFFVVVENKKKLFINASVGTAFAFGLSAFFWLPSMIERQFTLVDTILTGELAAYKLHFVCLSQLWNSPWGYGGSAPGCVDGMTYQLGKVNILLFVASFIVSLGYVVRKRISERIRIHFFFSFLFLFSVFMMLSVSSFIWDNISFLSYLQFPWRFLAFSGAFISVTAGLVFEELWKNKKMETIFTVFAIIASIFFVYKYSHYFIPQRFITTTDQERTSYQELAWRVSSTSYEFSPKETALKKTIYNTSTIDIDENHIPTSSFDVVTGGGTVEELVNLFSHKAYQVKATKPMVLQINQFNFPGWEALIDGKKTHINDDNRLHLIQLAVPIGNHRVEIFFRDTAIRTAGNWISIISLIIFIIIVFICYYKKREKSQQ